MKMWIVGVHHGDVQFKIILDTKFMLVNDDDGENGDEEEEEEEFWESIESIMMDAQFKIVVDARFMLINDDADDEEFWESRIMS